MKVRFYLLFKRLRTVIYEIREIRLDTVGILNRRIFPSRLGISTPLIAVEQNCQMTFDTEVYKDYTLEYLHIQ